MVRRMGLAAVAALAVSLGFAAPASASGTRFYTPPPNEGAVRQIVQLARSGQTGLAKKIAQMVATPQAVWETEGAGAELTRPVRTDVRRASLTRSVPVFVAYNLPFRDCGAYSAGGATSVAEYKAWIDAFAAGIGSHRALVMLEPDGLGIIPWHTDING